MMENKLKYEQAEIDIIVFETKDILTTSNPFDGEWDDVDGNGVLNV